MKRIVQITGMAKVDKTGSKKHGSSHDKTQNEPGRPRIPSSLYTHARSPGVRQPVSFPVSSAAIFQPVPESIFRRHIYSLSNSQFFADQQHPPSPRKFTTKLAPSYIKNCKVSLAKRPDPPLTPSHPVTLSEAKLHSR